MKRKFKVATLLLCAALGACSFAACAPIPPEGGGNNPPNGTDPIEELARTLLGAPKAVEKVDYSALNTDEYKAFQSSVEEFAADFAAYSYAEYEKAENFTVSPISVYMALALSSECAAGDTRKEILDVLRTTHAQLQTHFSTLYRSLSVEHKEDGKTTSLLDLSNSIWVNEGTNVKQSCIDALSNDYFAYSYSTDFALNNEGANKAVREFVKKQTRGLIDQDFKLSTDTLFALINTLYLKTAWGTMDGELPFAKDKYDFTAKDGSAKSVQMLQGEYFDGRVKEFEKFTTFYTRTGDGYKIKFILPNDGYTVDDVFTAENLSAVNAVSDYDGYDFATETQYKTRVLFPEYKCKYNEDIVNLVRDKFGIDLFFKDPFYFSPGCDFSSLSEEKCFCSKIRHVTDLTVNKKGIEGAAVTVIGMDVSAAPMMTVYEDFIINKAFGFIITDSRNVTLFSGAVNGI